MTIDNGNHTILDHHRNRAGQLPRVGKVQAGGEPNQVQSSLSTHIDIVSVGADQLIDHREIAESRKHLFKPGDECSLGNN